MALRPSPDEILSTLRRAGQLSVAFIATVFAGDLLVARGVIREREPVSGGFHWSLDVWVETKLGHKVTVGRATCVA